MTERLYYHDPFLFEFEGEITEVVPAAEINGRHGVFLDRTAFYPTSGGQVHDTGWITANNGAESTRLRVAEVVETEDGRVVHYIEADKPPERGTKIRGTIDASRRRDHMQQHSGQHVLSAAFIRLFNVPTVSFHMGDDYCSIDLETPALTREHLEQTERLTNEIILENRPVQVRFVTRDEAGKLGLRKLPPAERDELRLIDIQEFDLNACGGTHVNQTGQIGCILLRKTEKVRQGWRIEFVAGQRAVATARRDFTTLTEAGAIFSAHIYDVPQQIRKSLDEIRALRKQGEQSLEELAEAKAAALLAETSATEGRKVVSRAFSEREMNFIKLLAQKLTRLDTKVIALLGSTSPQPSLVFAQSAGLTNDMGSLLKQTVSTFGGRGGGSKDMAQGGIPSADGIEEALKYASTSLQG